MITAQNRALFVTHREAERRHAKEFRDEKSAAGAQTTDTTSDVVVDPLMLLGLTQHAARHRLELHLAGKNLTRMHASMMAFGNLEELWLSNNRLKRVEGLLPPAGHSDLADGHRGCARLKRLYLSDNAISTLDGDITRLKYLEILLLSNNKLSNLEEVSKRLAGLRFLKQLDLFGNPLAEEQNYRMYLVYRHPQIELLDRQSVTVEERRQAMELFGRLGKSFAASGSPTSPTASRATSSVSGAGAAMVKQLRGGTLASSAASGSNAVGFGTHVPYAPPIEPAGPVSASAKLVEAKVKQLRLQQRATEELERARVERDEAARAEKRRLFHSLWVAPSPQAPVAPLKATIVAATPSPPAAAAAAAYTPDPVAAQSRLYDLDDKDSGVARLIDLARQREVASTQARRQEIDAMISKEKHRLFPDRFGDDYSTAYATAKAAGRQQAESDYTDSLIKTVFSPSEMDSLNKLFKSNPINASDAAGLLRVLQNGAKVPATDWVRFFSSRIEADRVSALPLRTTLRLLCDFEPFIAARQDLGYAESQAAAVRGSGAAAAAAFKIVGALSDHRVKLDRERARSAESATLGRAFEELRRKPGYAAPSNDSDDE